MNINESCKVLSVVNAVSVLYSTDREATPAPTLILSRAVAGPRRGRLPTSRARPRAAGARRGGRAI